MKTNMKLNFATFFLEEKTTMLKDRFNHTSFLVCYMISLFVSATGLAEAGVITNVVVHEKAGITPATIP